MLRQDLTPVEEAEGLQALMTEQKYTQEQLGGIIGKARKKQARGMTTAYIAYKAKQQKGKTTRQKKDPNEPQAVFDMMDKAMTKIRTIDMSAWTDEDMINFQESLDGLKTQIDNYLNTPRQVPPFSFDYFTSMM